MRALWLGGPPGQTFERIRQKLLADGIEVIDVQNPFRGLPVAADLVLVNANFVGHGSFDVVRAKAVRKGVRCVCVSTHYSRTRARLEAAGVIARDSSLNVEEEDVTTRDKPNTAEIEGFVTKVAKGDLSYLSTLVERRLREDDVKFARDAFALLDANGVCDFLAGLDDAAKLELRKQLGVDRA